MRILLELVITFFKLGLFTFGGGYAMLPLLQREVVDQKGWATEEELLDYYAIGQSTPGIIAVNTATFIGFFQAGIPGAFLATFGLVLPSLIIILLVATILNQYMELALLQHAFGGIRVAVVALVSFSISRLAKVGVVDAFTLIWTLLTFLAIAFLNISPLLVVLVSFILGNIVQRREAGRP
ncbi:MAG TPA: chromate transporter [Firmicutes bacterium]|nr:chromate transporter [Bacillota bacterium]